MKETAALYIRLSLEDIDLDGDKQESVSVQNQRMYLRNYLGENPEIQYDEVQEFIDDGYSGTNFERPAFKEMLELIRSGQIKCIIVKDFSRFGRNYIEVGNYLEQIFPLLNIRFISVADQYDSHKDKGDVPGLEVVFKNIIHDYYSKELSRKVLQTKRSLALKGLFLGGIPPYGYLRNPQDPYHLVVDPDAAGTVQKIFRLTLEGKSRSEIARILNADKIESPARRLWQLGISYSDRTVEEISKKLWTAAAISRILRDEALLGSVTNHKVERRQMGRKELIAVNKEDAIIVEDMHEPIISYDIFAKVQEILKKGSTNRNIQRNIVYRPLSGFVKCEICKKNLVVEGRQEKKYICRHARIFNGTEHLKVEVSEEDLLKAVVNIVYFAVKLHREPQQSNASDQKSLQSDDPVKCSPHTGKRKLMELYEKYNRRDIGKELFLSEKKKIQDQENNTDAKEVQHENQAKKSGSDRLDKSEDLMKLDDVSWMTREIAHSLIKEIWISAEQKVRIVWKCTDWFKGKFLSLS